MKKTVTAAAALVLGLAACTAAAPGDEELRTGTARPPGPTYGNVRESWLTGRGYRKDAAGAFISAPARKAVAAGWIPFDAGYVDPETQPNPGADLFPCGDLWLELDDANDFHSRLLRWWKLKSKSFTTYSTCGRSTTRAALRCMDSVGPVLERIFGRTPRVAPTVVLLRNKEQYNAFAVTQGEIGELPSDSVGYAAFHYAFPCDRWLDRDAGYEHPGAACAYWDDSTAAGHAWGPYAVRHAAAQAYLEALDPSPVAVSAFLRDPSGPFPSEAFWGEKRLPLWLRYGVSVYCERFLETDGIDDPLVVRRWSLAELESMGGPVDVNALFEFHLDPAEPAEAARLLLSAGALVSYLVDEAPERNGPARRALIASTADRATPAESRELIRQVEAALLREQRSFLEFAAP